MATEERVTYCRICEPLCGMVATVEDGAVTKLRPDSEHPLSKGFACPKGIAMTEIQNDPDRVTHPLKRAADGNFERIPWEQALEEIGERLGAIKQVHGGGSIGWYMGNPGAFSYSHPLWAKGFLDGLGSQHYYTASSQDVSNRFAASSLLYGSPFVLPIPDLERCEILFMVGANPMVSHGSVMSAPRIKDQLHAITGRGGRVIVVDPRRTETASQFEHLSVNPDSDAWLLLSILHVIFGESLQDGAAASEARGIGALEALVGDFPPEKTETHTGVAAAEVQALARDLAAADGCAVYGRTGSCLGRSGTLVSFLLDALALVTGNLDREGGSLFGAGAIPFDRVAELIGAGTYGKLRSRIGSFPEVLGALPASLMAKEITTPGEGRMRALFVSAGNPALSVPNGPELEAAMEEARALRRRRPLRDRDFQARGLRPPGNDVPRARGLPPAVPLPVHDAVHPDDRSRGRAAWGGPPGVGDHRGDRLAGRCRSLLGACPAASGSCRDQDLAATVGRDDAQARP